MRFIGKIVFLVGKRTGGILKGGKIKGLTPILIFEGSFSQEQNILGSALLGLLL